jgi:hypothetical protein
MAGRNDSPVRRKGGATYKQKIKAFFLRTLDRRGKAFLI